MPVVPRAIPSGIERRTTMYLSSGESTWNSLQVIVVKWRWSRCAPSGELIIPRLKYFIINYESEKARTWSTIGRYWKMDILLLYRTGIERIKNTCSIDREGTGTHFRLLVYFPQKSISAKNWFQRGNWQSFWMFIFRNPQIAWYGKRISISIIMLFQDFHSIYLVITRTTDYKDAKLKWILFTTQIKAQITFLLQACQLLLEIWWQNIQEPLLIKPFNIKDASKHANWNK